MSISRRFDGAGIRRELRQSIDGGSGAVADSLDAIWADYGAIASWFFQGGVGRSGDTWTDRVGAYAATGVGVTMADATVGTAAAVRMSLDATEYVTATVDALGPFRVFALLSVAAPGATQLYVAARYGGVAYCQLGGGGVLGDALVVGDDGLTQSVVANDAYADGAPHVLRWEYSATNASHVARVDGAASPAPSGGDAVIVDVASTTLELAYVGGAAGVFDVALLACWPHAALDDTQAADIESRLIALGGI